jgi:hypothetical protein
VRDDGARRCWLRDYPCTAGEDRIPCTVGVIRHPAGRDYEDWAGIWRIGIGNPYIKAYRRPFYYPNTTSAITTLQWLDDGRQWSFNHLKVLYFEQLPDFEIAIVNMIPGTPLDELWPSLDAAAKQRYAERITAIHKELALNSPMQTRITGVDGKDAIDTDLALWDPQKKKYNFEPNHLLENCREIGMTCSYFLFGNTCVLPVNFFVDTETDTMGTVASSPSSGLPPSPLFPSRRIYAGSDTTRYGNSVRPWRSPF